MSGREVPEILRDQGSNAVILVEVVIASKYAGLRRVNVIRNDLKPANTRIVP